MAELRALTGKAGKKHLRLGIAKRGMVMFLEQIGFVQWHGRGVR
jgi:hypothetical protein